MGQYWLFANLDKRQVSRHLGKIGEFFFAHEPGAAILQNTIRPLPWTEEDLQNIRQGIPVYTGSVPAAHPLGVPADVVEQIFDATDGLLEAVCLSAVDRSLFDVGIGHITKLQKKHLGIWAGDRFVLAGNEFRSVPRALREYAASIHQEDAEKEGEDYSRESLYHLISRFTTYASPFPLHPRNPFRVWKEDVGGPLDIFYTKLRKDNTYDSVVKLFVPKVETTEDAPWVVANITKGLYIRADIVGGDKYNKTPFLRGQRSLGHVIMAFICYGMVDGTLKVYGLARAGWVGDAFEITTLDRLDMSRLGEGQTWEDVSSKGKQLLDDLWRAW